MQMDQDQSELLKTLLVAQVLTLAKTIEAEKRANGSSSTSHYVPDAVALIARERRQILALLDQSR
jgi:hypothetical protein